MAKKHTAILRLYRRILIISATALFIMAAAMPVSGAPKWETPKTERSDTKTVAHDQDTEIKAARGVVVVNSSKPVSIKIYTILGQLVNSETLPAGTSMLTIQAHGVYIIKTGSLTCKVAL